VNVLKPTLKRGLIVDTNCKYKKFKTHTAREIADAGGETVQGAAGQGGDDAGIADGEGEVGVSVYAARGRIIRGWAQQRHRLSYG
jgi:hypothetical protein